MEGWKGVSPNIRAKLKSDIFLWCVDTKGNQK